MIKSDSSKKINEYSQLLIHKDYLRYGKQAYFEDSVQISKNLHVLGAINNELFRTSSFAGSVNDVQIGNVAGTGKTNIQSGIVALEQYKGIVLVTNSNGDVLKTYRIENLPVPVVTDLNLYSGTIPSSPDFVLTSNYFTLLANRFNSLSTYIQNNYWKKSDWASGVIPALTLSGNLTVGGNTDLGLLHVNRTNNTATISANTTTITSPILRLTSFVNKVLVTDANGNVVQTHEIETTPVNHVFNPTTGAYTGLDDFTTINNVLTSKYYNILLQLIKSQNAFTVDNYWRKNQYETGVIPGLTVSGLLGGSSLNITNSLTADVNNIVALKPITFIDLVVFNGFNDKVLVTNASGTVLNQYVLFNGNAAYTLTSTTNPINSNVWNNLTWSIDNVTSGVEADNIIKYPVIKTIINGLNQVVTWCLSNFWRKDQYDTGEIPSIKVTSSLITDGVFYAGSDPTNRNIAVDSNDTIIGRTDGTSVLRGTVRLMNYGSADFLSTNINGTLNTDKSVSHDYPKMGWLDDGDQFQQAVSNTDFDFTYQMIRNDFYDTVFEYSVWETGDGIDESGIYQEPSNVNAVNKILTLRHFNYLWAHIRNIHYT